MMEQQALDLFDQPTKGPWDDIPSPDNRHLQTIGAYTAYTAGRIAELYRVVKDPIPPAWLHYQAAIHVAIETQELAFVRDVCKAVLSACVRDLLGKEEMQ